MFLLGATALYLLLGIFGAFWMRKSNSWVAFFGGVGLALYGALPGLGLSMDGRTQNNIWMEFAGQFLLFFFSVLGGALVGTAWSELRTQAKHAKQQ